MEPGDKCICQYDHWHNAFGDKDVSVHRGMRLTVLELKNVSGVRFYSFEETSPDSFYLHTGFKPLRSLN